MVCRSRLCATKYGRRESSSARMASRAYKSAHICLPPLPPETLCAVCSHFGIRFRVLAHELPSYPVVVRE